jgi:hypothetical protein
MLQLQKVVYVVGTRWSAARSKELVDKRALLEVRI